MQRGARFVFLRDANNAQKRLKIKVWDAVHFAGALPFSVALIFFAPERSHAAWRSFFDFGHSFSCPMLGPGEASETL